MLRVIFWLFLAAIALLPMPLGGNRPLFWSAFALIVGTLLLFSIPVWAKQDGNFPVPPKKIGWSLGLFGIVAAWGIIQTSTITPSGWHHPLWSMATQALGTPTDERITVNPASSWAGLMRLLSYLGVFWLALQFGRTRDNAKMLLWGIAIACFAYACYGLVVHLADSKSILWQAKLHYLNDLTATFINRNAYATYAGLGLIATLALFAQSLRFPKDTSLRERLLYSFEKLSGRSGVLAVMAVTLLTVLLLTHSRAGLACTLAGIVVLVGVPFFKRDGRKQWIPAITGIAMLPILWFSGGDTLTRLNRTDLAVEERPIVYVAVQKAIEDSPWFGFGLGTFEESFRLYRTAEVKSVFDRAHNDYLESAMDLGLPAAIALFLGVGLLAGRCLSGIRTRRRDVIYPAVALACTAQVGLHALVDFSLQIPAVAATYAALLGVGVAQSWSPRDTL